MATLVAYMGGGDYSHFPNGCPIIEADDTWTDRLAAKAFVLPRALHDASAYGAAWVQLRDGRGVPITARRPASPQMPGRA